MKAANTIQSNLQINLLILVITQKELKGKGAALSHNIKTDKYNTYHQGSPNNRVWTCESDYFVGDSHIT